MYWFVTYIRNKAFDWGIFKSTAFRVPVICVGNLSLGGTGKTPMIEWLVRELSDSIEVAVLSRGYKRTSTGFQIYSSQSTAAQFGDEPLQLAQKFNNITVAVDANRRNGIEQLLRLRPGLKLILLDDAFQHRWVFSDIKILLTTYQNPYFNDCVLPSGNLRESKDGAKRADFIVVTKCPNELSEEARSSFQTKLKLTSSQTGYFTSIGYPNRLVGKGSPLLVDFVKQEFVLVTGIAQPSSLLAYLDRHKASYTHLSFSDHHSFSDTDVARIKRIAGQNPILTTEKDAVRLRHLLTKESFFVLPMQMQFLNDSKTLVEVIKKQIT
jgi:tetraacyldisaccharide 4'-kinase